MEKNMTEISNTVENSKGFRAFLKRKDIEFSSKRYLQDALSSMAMGLFCSLLVGLILKTIGQQSINFFGETTIANTLIEIGGKAMELMGAAIGVAVAFGLKAPALVMISCCVTGMMGAAAGGPAGAFIAAAVGVIGFAVISLLPAILLLWLGSSSILNINKNGTVYDTIERRIQRLRNTTVRRMVSVTDNSAKDHMLSQVDYLDTQLAEIKKLKANSLALKIVNAIGKLDTLAYQERELNDLIDNMFANDLHVASTMWSKK